MTITARFPGRCRSCGGDFAAGEEIEWTRGEGAAHPVCPTTTTQNPGRKTGWGANGKRYDEECDRCHRESTLDNDSSLCESCFGRTQPVRPQVAEPYRRGIGQGFGSTEDGD